MITNSHRFSSVLFTALALLTAQNVFAGFPTSSGGSSYCFFGCSPTTSTDSTLVFDFNPDNEDGLAPVQVNFFPNPGTPDLGDLCWSGKVKGTIYNHVSDTYPSTGTATYDILSESGQNKGMCYSHVVRTIKPESEGTLGACTYRTYQYSLALKDTVVLTESSEPGSVAVMLSNDEVGGIVYDETKLLSLLNGRFAVNLSYDTVDAYDECDDYAACIANPGISDCGSEPKICNIETGFGVSNPETFIGFENLFPAETTLSGAPTAAGQVYFSDEVLVECEPTDVGADADSAAIGAKSTKIYLSESLSMYANWCTDSYSADPDCNAFNSEGERATGHVSTAIGDYQTQNADVTCINSMEDLQNLSSCTTELALATCEGSTYGFMQFPDAFDDASCTDENGEIISVETFLFSSAQGGGSSTVNVIAIGANADAPGYIGDNTLPPILPGWTAIVSTPDNQPNIWDLSGIETVQVAYIHVRNNDDYVLGTLGDDNILGGSGADELDGNDGDDILQGGDNTDVLNGGNGNDLLLGYECDSINATCGTFLNNGNDNDTLIGGSGNDCLDGGRGNDILTGSTGSDAFVVFGNVDNDTFADFTPGTYVPADPGEIDVVVNLTGGSLSTKYTNASNKNGTPDTCFIKVGGDTISLEDGTGASLSRSACSDVEFVTTLPAQCSGHPYSWPNNR